MGLQAFHFSRKRWYDADAVYALISKLEGEKQKLNEERSVEKRYAIECMEARKIPRSEWWPDAPFTPDKPLTYVFLEDLPKFVPAYGTHGWELKRETNFDRIIDRLEENFEPEAVREQRYRNRATYDTGDFTTGIGVGHVDS